MPVIHRSALLPVTARDMFEIVADVDRYQEFLPWCRSSRVLQAEERELVAELELHARGVSERFATRNVMFPHERIELHLVSGPFRSFEGAWRFTRLGADDGCKVELQLAFEFSGARALLGGLFPGIFVQAADQLVDAFCARARASLV
ncbi:MAG: type II toxin-antitoxin system RatA family toxin [Pseudomonadales bacterium]